MLRLGLFGIIVVAIFVASPQRGREALAFQPRLDTIARPLGDETARALGRVTIETARREGAAVLERSAAPANPAPAGAGRMNASGWTLRPTLEGGGR